MRENVPFYTTLIFTEHNDQSISTSHNNDLTVACLYFILFMPFWEKLLLQFGLTRPPLYNTIFPLWLFLRRDVRLNPHSVSPPSAACVSVTPSLTSCCFTNSWYTLPFPFLLFCWQKLHWWKLTCKVDSFVCLVQSLISLLSPFCICNVPPPPATSPRSLPPHFPPWARLLPSLNSPTRHMKWDSVP